MKRTSKRMSRRQVLKGGLLTGVGLLLPWGVNAAKALAKKNGGLRARALTTSAIPVSPDPAPISPAQYYTAPLVAAIPVARPVSSVPGVSSSYQISMNQGSIKFHPDLPATPTWGYNDSFGTFPFGYLGPTLEVRKNEQVTVQWINNLPDEADAPLGLADPNLIPSFITTNGRAVVHVHGGLNDQRYDGGPENWIGPGDSATYVYTNPTDAAQQWYHDHAIGVTRVNAYAGLAALYFTRDNVEDRLSIPKGAFEIPLVLQDKAFFTDGTGTLRLWYPNPWIPEAFGNAMMVNAQLWPVLEVEPRKYRFRMLNACQARFLHLRLSDAPASWTGTDPVFGTRIPNSVLPFNQIGTEGGFLPQAVQLNDILLGNAERADVIVDFKGMEGREIYLSNDAMTPFDPSQPPLDPDGDDPNPVLEGTGTPAVNVMQLMKFKVKSGPVADTTAIPSRIVSGNTVSLSSVRVKRQITLVEQPYIVDGVDTGFSKVLVNKREFVVLNAPTGGGGIITETPQMGTSEIWQFINMTPDTHPMHIHHTMFNVLDRQKLALNPDFDEATDPEYKRYLYGLDGDGNQISIIGDVDPKYLVPNTVVGPLANETSLKDTVKANPGEVTRVLLKFLRFPGKFVYHCHILEHEENDMMQYMNITAGPLAKEGQAPTQYALDQNYPNPFNPETEIGFQIPEDGHVRISIFNTAGQEVQRLVDTELAAGSHSARWNAGNFASGVYYYRLEAAGFAEVKKMMLLK